MRRRSDHAAGVGHEPSPANQGRPLQKTARPRRRHHAADPRLPPPQAGAIEAGDKLWIHRHGTWSCGKTDGNTYTSGTNEGSFDNLEFSLSVAAEPAPRTSIHAQIFVEKSAEGPEASIDYAFAEYAFAPALRFRIGAVKQPFGIFTETFDVGTLYPFVDLAQGIYGPAGIVAESFLGGGFTGRFEVGGSWQLQYDLYGGDMEAALSTPWAEAEPGAATESSSDIQDLGLAVDYFFSPNFVLKLAWHQVTGNRFTTSDDEATSQDKKTNLVVFGTSFSF